MSNKKVSVIGLGYIGLPTAAVFASNGTKVIGIDVDADVVGLINKGEIHIVEPGLDSMVKTAVGSGLLKASTTAESADAYLIAVPTPFKGDDHEPDLKYIEAAVKSIAPVIKKGDLVVLESTSPVGTTEKISHWFAEERSDLTFPHAVGESSDIRIAYCPERVLPGKIIHELIDNDRVIGGITDRCSEEAVKLYKKFVKGECVVTSARTAEMTKLTENAFRDLNIAFANELSVICDKLNINVWELIKLSNRHPRVNILQPGPGVGGHCIAVDPWFIVNKTPAEARLIHLARQVNDGKPNWVLEKIKKEIEKLVTGTPEDNLLVACYGVSFKPDIDDLRESPALQIVRNLLENSNVKLLIVEPNISELPTFLKSERCILSGLTKALETSDLNVLLVDHAEFRAVKKSSLDNKNIIDTKGIWT